MQRINGQQPGFRHLATSALSWLSHAKRQLKTLELQHALAVHLELESGSVPQEFDVDSISKIDLIVSKCHGLVTVDEESDIIRLVHYTTQEYLDLMRQKWFPKAESTITNVCTIYLTMDRFSYVYTNGSDKRNHSEIEEKLQLDPFFGYACVNWGHHARGTDYSSQIIHNFLASEWQVKTAAKAMRYIQIRKANDWRFQSVDINTAQELTAYFGAVDLMKSLPSVLGTTFGAATLGQALFSALCNKQIDAFRLLLEMGADTSVKNIDQWWDPLRLAAYWGEEDMVRLLLEWGAYPGGINSENSPPLTLAVEYGHIAIVRLLLEKGAGFDKFDDLDMTPIHHAVFSGDKARIQVFLDAFTDRNPKIYHLRNLMLKGAISYRNEEALKLVIEKSPKMKLKGKLGSQLLHWALTENFVIGRDIVELLLGKGAKLKQGGKYGKRKMLREINDGKEWLLENMHSFDIINWWIKKSCGI